MPYTALAVQNPVTAGATITFTTFDDTNGMKFPNDGKTRILLKNDNGVGNVNLVANTPGDVDGNAIDDLTGNNVADGAIQGLGPFKPEVYNQKTGDDKGHVLLDAGSGTFNSTVEVAAIRI